jgi:quercetin dioxygenase-like cupin family protein
MSTPFIIPAETSRSGPPFDIFGNAVTVKVSGKDTGGTFALMQDVTPPLGGPPLHRHVRDREVFSVLEGQFVFELDGVRATAAAGATVFIPPGVAHLYQNVGDQPGHMLIYIEPAGLDAFFSELDALLRASAAPDMPAIAALHGKYGMDLLGPPLSQR